MALNNCRSFFLFTVKRWIGQLSDLLTFPASASLLSVNDYAISDFKKTGNENKELLKLKLRVKVMA